MNRQDGPLLVGGINVNTNVAKPLKINDAGELIVTSGGAAGADVNLVSVGGAAIALGQAAMAASLPVVVASNQTDLPVSVQDSALPTGAATEAAQLLGNATLSSIDTQTASVIAAIGSTNALLGSLDGKTVVVDTSNVAIASLPNEGQQAMANSISVAIASDQSAVPVSLASAPTTSVTQGTSPWIVAGGGTAGTAATGVATIQGIASMTPVQVSQATATNLKAEVIGAGTAGSANAGVVTVQGIASMTPVQVSQATASNLNVTVASKTVYQRPAYGSAQTVFNSSTDIAAGNFSGAGTDFTNNDATIGAALYADCMIEMPDWAAAPVAGTTVDLYGLLINVDGTDDDTDAPSGTAAGGARYLGSWIIAAADALQRRTITISLAGIQNGFTPYVKNGTAQNMNNDGGTNMVLKITPWNLAMVG